MPNLRWSLLSLVLVLAIGGSAPLLGQDAGSTGDAPAAIRRRYGRCAANHSPNA